jgi:hypothetical protein
LGQRVGYLRVEKEEFIAACRGDVFIPICWALVARSRWIFSKILRILLFVGVGCCQVSVESIVSFN